jgi:hypothetical protein
MRLGRWKLGIAEPWPWMFINQHRSTRPLRSLHQKMKLKSTLVQILRIETMVHLTLAFPKMNPFRIHIRGRAFCPWTVLPRFLVSLKEIRKNIGRARMGKTIKHQFLEYCDLSWSNYFNAVALTKATAKVGIYSFFKAIDCLDQDSEHWEVSWTLSGQRYLTIFPMFTSIFLLYGCSFDKSYS